MTDLEKARQELYEVIESGSREQIMAASQELDKIILSHMYKQIMDKKHL